MPGKECIHCKKPNNADKWRYTLMTTVLFLIIVNPYTYKLVQGLLGGLCKIADPKTGCPTMCGILVHAVVFTLILRYVMEE
jgi:hypothetical protein